MSFKDEVAGFQFRHPVTDEILDLDSMGLQDLRDLNRVVKQQLGIARHLIVARPENSEALQVVSYLSLLNDVVERKIVGTILGDR